MLNELKKFFNKREKKLQELTGLSDAKFKKKIADIVTNVSDSYQSNKLTGIDAIDKLRKALEINEDRQEDYMNNTKALGNAARN